MKAGTAFVVVVALAGLLSVNAAASAEETRSTRAGSAVPKIWNDVYAQSTTDAIDSDSNDDKRPAIIVEYAVPPPVGKEFVKAFKIFAAGAASLKGVEALALTRTITDNLAYYLLGEFESRQAYSNYKDSAIFKEYLKNISTIGVVYKVHGVKSISEKSVNATSAGTKKVQNVMVPSPVSADTTHKRPVVLVEYAVPPSVTKHFVEHFNKLQDAVTNQEGVDIFGLSRTIEDNLYFYLFSEFDSRQTYAEHKDSRPLKDFAKAISDISVVYKIYPLKPIVLD